MTTLRNRLIATLQTVPHLAGGGDLAGADCWGIVEIWYYRVCHVRLGDRAEHPPGPRGFAAGFAAAEHWTQIEEPEDDCLVVMRHGRLAAGHVGISYDGHVLHSSAGQGCVFEPLNSRRLRGQITCYLRYTP